MADQNLIVPDPAQYNGVQRASLELQIGTGARMRAEVAVTSAGLLSIGALVSSILLSTAVIVRVARKQRAKRDADRAGKRAYERKRLRRL